MRFFLLSIISFLFISQASFGQIIQDPTSWAYETKKIKENEYELIVKLKIQNGWHLWSINPAGDGLQEAPTFSFSKNKDVTTLGKLIEKGNMKSSTFHDIVEPAANYYEQEVVYVQKVKVKANTEINLKHTYQVCNDNMCLPTKTKNNVFKITDIKTEEKIEDTTQKNVAVVQTPTQSDSPVNSSIVSEPALNNVDTNKIASNREESAQNNMEAVAPTKSHLSTWITGFGWGLASVVTPCVFAMLPMTVGFFLKRSKTKAQGKKNAIIYALCIIGILTLLGALISVIGGNTLNNISTNWIVNLFFAVVFIIFGISFLGAFELNLPSSWSTFSDSKANMNSVIGIFFMALTLVIVSFSCTGPFLGNMLIESTKSGKIGPTVGFNGFSVGLALPFALFALFPALLQKLSQGGWLNAVKVTFGIVELALALKFLSNADLAKQWRLLDREIFIAIWFVLAFVLGLYLLGKIRFSHDSELPKNHNGLEYLTVTRTFFAIASLTFAIYLLPGMWGAPLKGMSAFLPPMGTQDYVVGGNGSVSSNTNNSTHSEGGIKYADKMKIYEPESVRSFGLSTYFDYKEALAASKKLKKPIMLDFTGINCVNCRKMEAQVWSHPEVLKRLKENFIIASLYSDVDNIDLPESERFDSKYLGTKVITLGDYNEDLQATKFNSNSQPYYFYIDESETKLSSQGYSYDPSVAKFIKYLDEVLANYKKLHP